MQFFVVSDTDVAAVVALLDELPDRAKVDTVIRTLQANPAPERAVLVHPEGAPDAAASAPLEP